ncbi:hypothetical protein VTO42DRAFT_6043 [Malbranchea cinnamomea]
MSPVLNLQAPALLVLTAAALVICKKYVLAGRKDLSASVASKAVVKDEPTSINVRDIKPIAPNFDWREQDEIPYRPWSDGPYHITMGLKKVNVEDWIELDKTYLDKYRLKQDLFRERRDDVLQILPGCDDAAFEALDLLVDVLPRRYPTMFRRLEPSKIENLVTGDVWDVRRESPIWEKYHPLEVMSLLATEDFFILQTDGETATTTLRAGCVCFPAGWKIRERIGHSLWQLHAGKVPQYESKLAKSMDKFFTNLRVESSIQRFNFAIDDSPDLFHPHSHHNLTPEQLGREISLSDLHLRVERQVLQRLPRTRAFMFSIRTYITPITKVTEDRAVARALRTNVNSFTEDVARYKNKPLWENLLKEHLDEVLGTEDE